MPRETSTVLGGLTFSPHFDAWGTPLLSMLLYHALGSIALVFSAIMVCNKAYPVPAGRDSEIAPSNGFGRFTGTDSMTEESIVLQMRSQSNRSWYRNLSPSG